MVRILLFRHGESVGNRERRMPGRSDDALTLQGKIQTQQLGQALADQSWIPTQVYTSPWVRSLQTAQILITQLTERANVATIPCIQDDRLGEINNGIFGGLTWSEAQSLDPQLCQTLESSLNWIPIPQAESPLACRYRARSFMTDLIDRHVPDHAQGDRVKADHEDRIWIVSHGGFLPYLLSEILGCDRTWGMNIPNLGCFELSWQGGHFPHFPLDLQECQPAFPPELQQEYHNTARWQIHRFCELFIPAIAMSSTLQSSSVSYPTPRTATVQRATGETQVAVSLNLDGHGHCQVETGIPFLDHMLHQLASHGLVDLDIKATGDWEIDDHHTNEDVGITLGQALAKALGDRKGIVRFGHFVAPLDEALVQVALDFSGRPHLSYGLTIPTERVGTYDTQLVREFFVAVVNHSQMTLHIRQLDGLNSHHIIEATFKAFARSLRMALEFDPRRSGSIPSSKGVL